MCDLYTKNMNTELLDAVRTIIREELKSIHGRLGAIEARQDKTEVEIVNLQAFVKSGFRLIREQIYEQSERIDALHEGWTIQKIHRRELDDHKGRITNLENRVPFIS